MDKDWELCFELYDLGRPCISEYKLADFDNGVTL